MFILLEALDHIGFLTAYYSGNGNTILILQDREAIADDAQLIQFIADDAHSSSPLLSDYIIIQNHFLIILHQLRFLGMGVGKAAGEGELLGCCVLSEAVVGNLRCA